MKKEILKKILEKLTPYREMAWDFLLILEESDEEDKDFIDTLYNQILQNIKQIKSKDQLQKIWNELKSIKNKELIENRKDQESLDSLEFLIDNIE